MNASSRLTKNKARLARYDALLAEERNAKLDNVEIHIPAGPRLGDVVVEAEGVSKAYGDRLLIEDLTFKLPPRGDRGRDRRQRRRQDHAAAHDHRRASSPTAATLRVGETVELSYVDQSRDALDGDEDRVGGDLRRRRPDHGRRARR